jgi:hypothetical protein
MLRIASLFGLCLFLLGHIMVFFTGKHDPINASILMLALLLMALSITHLFLIAYAPVSTRWGALLLFLGLFAHALLQFDIMGLGISAQFTHYDKPLAHFALFAPLLGSAFIFHWLRNEHPDEILRGGLFMGGALFYGAAQAFFTSPVLSLVAALIFASSFLYLSFLNTQKY